MRPGSGRALGVLGLALAATALVALAVYGLLTYLGERSAEQQQVRGRGCARLALVFEIGSSLREARMRQGLDFEEMEERTKVREKYLRHLEDEHFDQLPGHTYTRGSCSVYADSLGLDGRLYVEEYNSRYVAGEDEALPRVPPRLLRATARRATAGTGRAESPSRRSSS